MRVLYFHQHFTTPRGSGGTRSYEFAQELIRHGHQVTMVCGSHNTGSTGLTGPVVGGIRRGMVDGIDVIEVNLPYSNRDSFIKRSITFLRYALRSLRFVFKERYDLLFATSTPLTAAIPGIVMKLGLVRKPFVFEVRDLWPELPREMKVITNPVVLGAMSVLEWLGYRTADAAIGLSPGIVKGIRRRSSRKLPVSMIPNGCDLADFVPGDRAKLKIQGVGPKDLVAVFTGAHGMANGLDAVLDAAVELKRMGRKDVKLVFIGDGKLKPVLQERAQREGLDNCLFLPPVPKKQLTEIVQSVDVGLMILANVPAFYYGTSPNKFFDYISTGLPVLNNYPGWLADLIKQNDCGVAVPPSDPKAFAEGLAYLADNAERRREMGRNARALAEREFGRPKLAGAFVTAIEDAYRAYYGARAQVK